MSFYDHNGIIPSAGYSQNPTSPKSLENPLQQASASRPLSAGLANAKSAANSSFTLSTTHISAAPGGIHSQVSVYKHFHPHVPSLYMPGLDDHIEGQRFYHNEYQRTYFKISVLQMLATSVHIIICGNILEEATNKTGIHLDISTGVFGVERDARESPIDRIIDLSLIGIILFNHYSIGYYKGF